jgi:Tol biopolymer transport system component
MKSLCLASAFSAALVLTSFAVTALNAQSQIAFSSDRTSRYQIFTVAIAQGSVPTQVTTGGAGSQVSSEPDWSPSGTLAYEFGAPGVRGIHTINPNGTGDIQITPPGSGSYPCTDDTEPAWSPDASYISLYLPEQWHLCHMATQ